MAAAVASIEVVRRNGAGGDGHSDTVVKIRFWNKLQALELLHKNLGLAEKPPPSPVPMFVLTQMPQLTPYPTVKRDEGNDV